MSDRGPGVESEHVRTFFALSPDAIARQRIAEAAASLQLAPGSRLVAAQNYHATLAFVGEVPRTQVDTLHQIASAQMASSFALRFDAFEYWPKPEVIVAAARAVPDPLEQLWKQLHEALAAHRWAQNPKRLRPHVTLAHKVAQDPDLPPLPPFAWRVRDFCLMRSEPRQCGTVYTVLGTWSLLDDSPAP